MRIYSGKFVSTSRYRGSTTLTTTCLGIKDGYSYIFKDIIMPFSFFMGVLMNDITTIVNHKLCLYSIYFFFFPKE